MAASLLPPQQLLPLTIPAESCSKDEGESGSSSSNRSSTLSQAPEFQHVHDLKSSRQERSSTRPSITLFLSFASMAICSYVLLIMGSIHFRVAPCSQATAKFASPFPDSAAIHTQRKLLMLDVDRIDEGGESLGHVGSEGRSRNIRLIQHERSRYAITSGELNFLVVGDWGRKGLYNQSRVAAQMGRIGEQLGIEFVISVGDNFYDTGLTGADDPAFTASFTDVYTSPSLQTVWYSVLGNHDYMGDALSQLSDEIVKRDPRWFCRKDFQLRIPLGISFDDSDMSTHAQARALSEASVDMFFIDTTPFIDEYWSPNQTQTFDWRGLAPRPQQLQSQLERLAEDLETSNATWKVVFGHHTIRSVGHHGDLMELVDQLLPILEKYEVDMYINGHDHNLQHIKRADSSVHLFTSGAGSKAYSGLRPYTQEQDGVQFAYDGQGFLSMSMKPNSASLIFYDVFGTEIYSYDIQK